MNCEDCINIFDATYLKNCYDNSYNEKSQFCIEADTCYELYECKFCTYAGNSHFATYCDQCFNLEYAFGCVGLNKFKYMILNKQYSEEEYKEIMQRIELHMKSTGEWGNPFPSNLTSFAYNTTLAFEYYPLSKEQALGLGYMWHDEETQQQCPEKYEMPENINDVDESICSKTLFSKKAENLIK